MTSRLDEKNLGYFSESGQTKPTFDPGFSVPCAMCGNEMSKGNVSTISLLIPGDHRSFFYRVHKGCALDEEAVAELEGKFIDERALSHKGTSNG